jgi:hypothetical protein
MIKPSNTKYVRRKPLSSLRLFNKRSPSITQHPPSRLKLPFTKVNPTKTRPYEAEQFQHRTSPLGHSFRAQHQALLLVNTFGEVCTAFTLWWSNMQAKTSSLVDCEDLAGVCRKENMSDATQLTNGGSLNAKYILAVQPATKYLRLKRINPLSG